MWLIDSQSEMKRSPYPSEGLSHLSASAMLGRVLPFLVCVCSVQRACPASFKCPAPACVEMCPIDCEHVGLPAEAGCC
jgi:hypothetical protein